MPLPMFYSLSLTFALQEERCRLIFSAFEQMGIVTHWNRMLGEFVRIP